jgi:GTP-binding protein Era
MTTPEASPPAATRAGFVALIGATNAGKSTLINRLVGGKVSIVSRKVQTTRSLIRGIAVDGDTQVVFVDTPGIFAPRRRLDRAMVASAWSGASDADLVLLLVDVKKAEAEDTATILDRLAGVRKPVHLAINKIDTLDRQALLAVSASLNARHGFAETYMISAETGDGVERLLAGVASAMPPGPWLYPPDQMSDAPLRFLAAEITREKLFDRLHEELPYSLTVETEAWETLKDGSAKINQTIFVTREGHKKIVIGAKGATLKAIGAAARRDIEEVIEGRAHLFLFVKVREKWQDDPERYREMGLDWGE